MEKMVNAEFFDALEQLEKEKGIPVDYMLDRVGQALITAYKRDNDGMTDNVYVEPNREEKTIRMYVRKTVVRTEDLYEPYEEITLEEAADYKVIRRSATSSTSTSRPSRSAASLPRPQSRSSFRASARRSAAWSSPSSRARSTRS